MILAAGALVLLGLGLFVAGIVTDVTILYWLCVAACVVAGVLLVAARLRIGRAPASLPAASSTRATRATVLPPAVGATAAPVAAPPAAPVAEPAGTAPAEPAPAEPAAAPPPLGAHASGGTAAAGGEGGDPPVEEVEVTDLLLVVDLHDEVLVVDEHPRYHLAGCRWLAGRTTIPLPLDEARTDGFTPCARCSPDRNLAERERGRRTGRTP